MTSRFSSPEDIADAVVSRVGKNIVLALPLGVGKPCHIVNALVKRAVADPTIHLKIFTALTLETPRPGSDMEKRFLGPATDRLFGDYPELSYAQHLRAGTLPANIGVNEFFFLAGRWLKNTSAQSSHISANYTHVFGYMLDRGVNVVAQLLARRRRGEDLEYSLASNTDITLDLLKARRDGKADFLVAAQANSDMPFMGGDAVVPEKELDLVLDSPETEFELFSAPRRPITTSDQAIGLHVARLVRDGGTLQVGIGSMGDAVSAALILRHESNQEFRELVSMLATEKFDGYSDCGRFAQGLYASSEMFVNGLLELVEHDVIRREVDGALVHAGFFVESREFYARLRAMSDEERSRFQMTTVSFTNQLYCGEEEKRKARVKACFINNAMKATLLGAVISDGLADGAVVSGVGGQFNFVTQAFALPDARSVLTLASTRTSKGKLTSNIVWSFPHETVPRHMRDIIVTEYGIADLKGKSDAEVIAAMLSVTDSRFQPELLVRARQAGKIASDYEIPEQYRNNTPEKIESVIARGKSDGTLQTFPFGTAFTPTEQRLLPALGEMKAASYSKRRLYELLKSGMTSRPLAEHDECLDRMGLLQPRSLKERFYGCLLRGALVKTRGTV